MSQIEEAAAVRRLWARLGFGPAPGAPTTSFGALAAELLRVVPEPVQPPQLAPIPQRTKKTSPAEREEQNKLRAKNTKVLTQWWLQRMLASSSPAQERLTWFWHGHFATSIRAVRDAGEMLAQNQLFRTHALGSFGDLAHGIIVDPAMLRWLNGVQNKAGAPNENLSREFMELFTLGKGRYTERDVVEGARALTGWTVKDGKAKLAKKRHDDGVKEFLGTKGNLDAHGFVDQVLRQPGCDEFVLGRLARQLVGDKPLSASSMAKVRAAYGPDRNIAKAVTAIVQCGEFVDSESQVVKSPVEWALQLMRAVGLRADALDDERTKKLLPKLTGMGQVPFAPPNVGGWTGGQSWLNSGTTANRYAVAQLICTWAGPKLASTPRQARIERVAQILGVPAFEDATQTGLAKVADEPTTVLAVAACSPEYVISR